MSEEMGREFGWDDEIQNDSPDYVTLPEGDYDFEVLSFERGRYAGGDKIPPCNMAVLKLKIEGPQGVSTFNHRLYLHSKTEGLLCAFFTAIGQRKHGERSKMNWNTVTGAKGRAKIEVRTWHNDKGDEFTSNQVKRFYDPEEAPAAAPAPAPQQTWQPGKF